MFHNQPAFAQSRPVPQMGHPLAPDLTHADLSSHLGTVSSSGALYREFFYSQVQTQNGDESPRWQTRLCLATAVRGDRLTVAHTFIPEEIAQREFPQEWHRFTTSGLEQAAHGTPLHELPGMSNSQLAYLALHRVRTIEDLVQIGRDRAMQIGIEASAAWDLANAWLTKTTAGAAQREAAERAALAEAASAASAAREKGMEAQIAALTAQVAILVQGGAGVGQVAPSSSAAIAVEGEAFTRKSDEDAFAYGSGGTVSGNDDLGGPTGNDDLEELAAPVPAPSRRSRS